MASPALTGLVVALLVYGNVVAYRGVRAPVVVVMNLALGTALVAVARAVGVSWHALGLDPALVPRGAAWGGAVAAALVLGGALVAATPLRRGFADLRTVRMVPRELAFHYVVRIPFGTALFEEVVFRGVILALLAREASALTAIVLSSAAFGLWHVGASLDFLRANQPDPSARQKVTAVVAGIAITAAAGVGFAVLRVASESLMAPVLAHAAINAVGLTLARTAGGHGSPQRAVP